MYSCSLTHTYAKRVRSLRNLPPPPPARQVFPPAPFAHSIPPPLFVIPTGQARAQADEFALLPPLRGGDLGWEYVGRKGASRNTFGPGSNSALVGDYRCVAGIYGKISVSVGRVVSDSEYACNRHSDCKPLSLIAAVWVVVYN
jgi:hypothetical protein